MSDQIGNNSRLLVKAVLDNNMADIERLIPISAPTHNGNTQAAEWLWPYSCAEMALNLMNDM